MPVAQRKGLVFQQKKKHFCNTNLSLFVRYFEQENIHPPEPGACNWWLQSLLFLKHLPQQHTYNTLKIIFFFRFLLYSSTKFLTLWFNVF